MNAKILQIGFNFAGSRKEFEEAFNEAAPPIAEQPGLQWKIWIWNDEERYGGGVYLFEDESSVQAYLAEPIVEQIKVHPALSNVSARVLDVVEKPTAITRGPIHKEARV